MNSSRVRVLALVLADVLSVGTAWALVVFLYKIFGGAFYEPLGYLKAWPVILIFLSINLVGRLYHGRCFYPALPVAPVEEFRRLVLSSLATHILVMAILGFGRNVEVISRFVLIVSGLLTACWTQLFRDAVRLFLKRFGLGQIEAFLVGEGEAVDRMVKILETSSYYGVRLVRRFSRHDLREVVPAAKKADVRMLFCCYRDDRFFTAQVPKFVKWFQFIEYLPMTDTIPAADAHVVQISGVGGLEMVNQRRLGTLSLEKKIVDRTLALTLFVLCIPLFVIVAILIKLTSRGPVFYRAKRLGKGGKKIYLWKFRSMYINADMRLKKLLAADAKLADEYRRQYKLRNDPRVTPLGRFLRRTSIDELPQLFNVFRGDMALIGPRPIVKNEISYYGDRYGVFSSVKPGITGLWQASGRSDCTYEERVLLDVHYVLNWSPWMDFWIVLKTAIAVLRMKGSY